MARKKGKGQKGRQVVQQRDRVTQFLTRVVFATLASSVIMLFGTLSLSPVSQEPRWKTLFQIYQFMPPVIGLLSAYLAGKIKALTRGKSSLNLYAVLTAALLSGLLVTALYLLVR